ncbi:MAG TPA: tetratricopeptide repeat protein [Bacteroidales bacterium]|nr:tetratricopeptide repeat protein [Bacteroidales bacterium]
MRKFSICLISIVLLIYSFNTTFSQETPDVDKGVSNNQELEFYFAFTEATKLFLFGNLIQAASLYNECLKYQPGNAAVHYQLAQIYLKAGELKRARQHAVNAYILENTNKWYALELAGIYRLNQQNDSAIILYEEQLRQNPDDVGLLFMMASLQEQEENYETALASLQLAEEKIGVAKDIYVGRFRIFRLLNENDKALKNLKLAQLLDEEDYKLWGLMAEYYRTVDNPDSARFCYHKMLNIADNKDPTPKFSYAEFLLEENLADSAGIYLNEVIQNKDIDIGDKAGYIYRLIQNTELFNNSRSILDELIEEFLMLGKTDLRVMSIYADVEYRLRNYDKSAAMLKEIVRIDRGNQAAWEQLLFSENFLGNVDSIIYYGNQAVMVLENRAVPYLLLGSAYYRKNDNTGAIQALGKGLELAKDKSLQFEFYALLAESYVKIENHGKSDFYFNKALEIDLWNTGVRNNYAYYLSLRNENLRLARELSKFTVRKEPDNATFLDTYAWVLFCSGKTGQAKKYLDMALKNGGGKNGEVLKHYGDILYRLKDYRNALDNWKKALETGDIDKPEELMEKIRQLEDKLK